MPTTLDDFVTSIRSKSCLDDDMMAKAEKLGQELGGVTTSKMRQYFDDIKGLRRMVESRASAQQVKVKLRLVQSRLAYDVGRASKKQRPDMEKLKRFLDAGISRVLNSNDACQAVKDFAVFFECVYGYFYSNAKPENEEER